MNKTKNKFSSNVKWKLLKEICNVSIGEFVHRNEQSNTYSYPVYNGGIGYTGFYKNFNYSANKIIISARGSNAGFVNKIEEDFWAGNSCYILENLHQSIDINYFYYYLKNYEKIFMIMRHSATIPALSKKQIENILVPILPINVQKNITELIIKLENKINEHKEELRKELNLRKDQYVKYRNKTLSFDDTVPRVKLKSVCRDFIVPIRNKPEYFSGDIPWCRIDDIEGKYLKGTKSNKYVSREIIDQMNLKVFPTGTVICSCSASLGTYVINTCPLITNQTFIGIVTGEKLRNTFLRYYMETQTKHLEYLSNSSTIPYISRKKFENLIIPLPSIPMQEKIVNKLEKMQKLYENLYEKLLLEIKVMGKIYEYYRDIFFDFG